MIAFEQSLDQMTANQTQTSFNKGVNNGNVAASVRSSVDDYHEKKRRSVEHLQIP